MDNLKSKWSPRHSLYNFAARLGFRRLFLILFAIFSIEIGIFTAFGYSASPEDAPDLLIPLVVRVFLWIGLALVSIVLLLQGKTRHDKTAILLLAVMPMVRLVSYLVSYALSFTTLWDSTDNLVGSDKAFYWSIQYQISIMVLVVLGWVPNKWEDILAALKRERVEEKLLEGRKAIEEDSEDLEIPTTERR